MVKSAKDEIQIIFSTANTLLSQKSAGGGSSGSSLLKLLADKLASQDSLRVRILLPADSSNINPRLTVEKYLKQRDNKIVI